MRIIGATVMLALALLACSDSPARQAPATRSSATVPASATAPSSRPTTPTPDEWRLESPLTNADASFAIPAERDGRKLEVVGSYGEEILLSAQKDVPYLPGEVIGQGAKAYDQLFLLWNPQTNDFREVWANQSVRRESVLGIDGDWVLSELYRLNPANFWILRVRNLSTGEVRDIDQESEAARGLEYPMSPQIDDDRVIYTKTTGLPIQQSAIVIYNVASGTAETLEEATWDDASGGRQMIEATIDGSRVAWSQEESGRISTIVRDLVTNQEQVVSDPKLGMCHLVPGSAYLICNSVSSVRSSSQAEAERIVAYNVDDGSLQLLTAKGSLPYSAWHGWFVTANILWNSSGTVGRALDPALVGATPSVVDGWFTWIAWKDDATGRRDFANSTLYVMRLK